MRAVLDSLRGVARAGRRAPLAFAALVFFAFVVFAALPVISLAAPQHPHAQETILSYQSEITVNKDSTVLIRETIRVRGAGQQIRHGIYRDFPTHYGDPWGNAYSVGFNVLEVQRDAAVEDYHFGELSNGTRVYMGKQNVVLPPGEYTYTLTYQTNRQLGFFADHDELYWNVTGNGWLFSIEQAQATVHLPEGLSADEVHFEAFTGPMGATGKDYEAHHDGSAVVFTTTRPLRPRQGLTIVVSWPKGYVTKPGLAEQLNYFLRDNRAVVAGLIGLLVVFVYYLAVWSVVGRDPTPGTIVVKYEPPANFSPAAVRFLARMGFDQKTFATAILDMAVKKFLTIREQAGTYTLARDSGKLDALSAEEKVIAGSLLDGVPHLELTQLNHSAIQSALKGAANALKASEERIYFVTNSRYFVPGLLLSILALVAAVATMPIPNMAVTMFMCVWLTIWTTAVTAMVITIVRLWAGVITGTGGGGKSLMSAVVLTAFSVPFIAGEGFGSWMLAHSASPWFVVLLAALVGTNFLFHYLLKAPTRAGRAVLDQIEGFKRFLSAVEGDRLNRLPTPEKTPALFEKFLPYAVALDVEKAWSAQFTDVLSSAGQAGSNYSPSWYSGNGWSTFGAAGFASALGGSLSSAISSASSAPGSSSGGGGGSSGGGGGGGGGGGW